MTQLTVDIGELAGRMWRVPPTPQSAPPMLVGWVECSAPAVIADKLRLGRPQLLFDAAGLATLDLPATVDDLADVRYQVVVQWSDGGSPDGRLTTWRSGWFALTEPSDLADLVTTDIPGPASTALDAHIAATTSVHGIADTSALVVDTDPRLADTGWRDISTLLVNGWATSGQGVQLRRVGRVVDLWLGALNASAASSTILMTLPAGFREGTHYNSRFAARQASGTGIVWGSINEAGVVYLAQTSTQDGTRITYTTTQSWPSVLPGTAA